MSGHSKWASIKHKKAANDSKKGKIWSKIAKEITIAVKEGGSPDPAQNARLRMVIVKAKGTNMPNDNIDRAIKRGAGGGDGATIEEISYEGYAPGGVAIIVDVATDNKNRTAAEIRSIFSKNGGNLAENGSVSWQFKKKAIVMIPSAGNTEENLMDIVLDAGAEDIEQDGEVFTITGPMESLSSIVDALKEKGIEPESAEIVRVADNNMTIAEAEAKKVMKILSLFEDHDDVSAVATNLEITDNLIEE
ncbi:YebC/PmpR family DNA-binding transcriptional regulator [Brachyspira catarrhinii]|uniref:Probable transcriptional regulatory protein EZH24_07300 n=1 Tax=Brachyspira catarrhinii TaxID=2528966 RepID=A0ABY2TT46_9SPIR|nr:YebC/PmpR family DNA-binding transcriptional regulator [Brachyspira catarrhinii]TKZ35052.1 YebC/PmpR family DNA-binding transcriptional regulator [Brachyspira catarrhinii]